MSAEADVCVVCVCHHPCMKRARRLCVCSRWLGVPLSASCSSGCSSSDAGRHVLDRPLVNLQQMLRSFFSVPQSPLCTRRKPGLKHTSEPNSVPLPLQMSRCQPFEPNPPLRSFIQGRGMWAVCAASPALAVPLAFIYAASVNIHLYPTAADDISHPSQAFVS